MSGLSTPINTFNIVGEESHERACGCMKLCCPLQQSPSCGAHWRAGLLVWPPYAGVWGPGCQRSSSTWRAVGGHMVGGSGVVVVVVVEGGCSRSTSIVPGGQELSRTQQESGGPFLKSDQLELLFSHPAHFTLLCISSSPSLFPLPSPPFLGRLIHWLKCDFLMKLHSPPRIPFPPTRPTNLFSTGIKSSHAALFFNHLVHIKVSHERMVKRRKGPGTRQISLAFPSHNASHLNSPIYCWSPFWMVPLMKCCFCGSSHEFQRPRGYIFLFLSLTSKLSGTRRVGMTKLRGHQVQHWMLFTNLLTKSRNIKTMESPQGITQNIFQALRLFWGWIHVMGKTFFLHLLGLKERPFVLMIFQFMGYTPQSINT